MTDYMKVSELDASTVMAAGDLLDISQDAGGGAYASKKITWANVAAAATTAAAGTLLKLDASNDPVTGNLEISKAVPTLDMTDSTSTFSTTLSKNTTGGGTVNEFKVLNDVEYSGGTGFAVKNAGDYSTGGWLTTGSQLGINGATAVTVRCVIKLDNQAVSGSILSNTSVAVQLYYDGSNRRFQAQVKNASSSSQVAYGSGSKTSGVIYDVAMTWTSGEAVRLYVNGALDATSSGTLSGEVLSGTNYFMFIDGSVSDPAKFSLCDLGLWKNRQLSLAQLQALYNSATYRQCDYYATSLQAYWKMNEGSGTTIDDSSANSYTATFRPTLSWITGFVSTGLVAYQATALSHKDGTAVTEKAIMTVGDSLTRTILNGSGVRMQVGAAEQLALSDGVLAPSVTNDIDLGTAALQYKHQYHADSGTIYLGNAQDASVAFDGDSLNIKSNLVTATDKLELSGGTNGIDLIIGTTSQAKVVDGAIQPTTTNDVDLGTSSLLYKNAYLAGKLSYYNNIATVSNGVPSELATVDLTAQEAAKSATTIYTPAASGMFRLSVVLQVTRAATTSSVLGGATGVVITYTEPDGSVAQSVAPLLSDQAGAVVVPATGNVGNATTTQSHGSCVIYAKTAVAIQYAIGYTSVGATTMQYAAHFKCEAM